MKISRLLPRTIALAALAVVGAGAVHAQSVTPVFISAVGAPGNFTYTYQLFSTADTRVSTGDLFTVYDFDGLLTGGANDPTFTPGQAGVNYAVSVQNLGLNPPNALIPPDNPGLANVSLTYNGSTNPFINPGPGSQLLGTLTLHSANGVNLAGDFTPFAANSIKNSNDTPAGNQGFVTGPNAAPVTPEPGAWAMFVGMGISGAAFARRRTRRK
jgi:hypothetical protein